MVAFSYAILLWKVTYPIPFDSPSSSLIIDTYAMSPKIENAYSNNCVVVLGIFNTLTVNTSYWTSFINVAWNYFSFNDDYASVAS
jgi:hypothetical protein